MKSSALFAQALGLSILGRLPAASADWQFRSRPDLSPPRLNITVPADRAAVDPGYIFVFAYPGFTPGFEGPAQPAPYILRDDGELVWSGLGYVSGWGAHFRPGEYLGQQVLFAFQGQMSAQQGIMHGNHVVLNQKYEVIRTVKAGNHRLESAHEFRLLDGKTVLIETPIIKPVDLAPWGGSEGQEWIVSNGFQELDLETGEVKFEWEHLDHIDPQYTAFPINDTSYLGGDVGDGRTSNTAWNHFHINSVDKDDEGHYLISARNYCAIFKINGTSGDIIWQLGGLHGRSTLDVAPSARFAFQHDARFLNRSADGAIEVISLHDNAAHTGGWGDDLFTNGKILQLNHTDGTASLLAKYPAPDELTAWSQGNVQVLPSGNVFANWGQAGAVTEFNAAGDVLFHAYLDSAPVGKQVQSYRGFRSEWHGTPSETPALVAVKGGEGNHVDLYVSWNGDTETRSWRFWAQSQDGARVLLGDVERRGFETRLRLESSRLDRDAVVTAEAVGSQGKTLVTTPSVAVVVGLQAPSAEANDGENQPWSEDL